jgi:hypothetical protein
METNLVTDVGPEERRRRRSARAVAVSLIGPLTAAGGLLWAFAQPYRITLLHPRGQGFWFLLVEPPLLVILVGVVFQLLIVPSLLADLGDAE